ncbi:MAG: hypothetical protein ABIQ58_03650 [Candidatus Limnocylindrales bacterium]
MDPLLLVLAGVVALAVGGLILRGYGPRYRVGRLLVATPIVSIAEARGLAGGPARYVGVRGRIDAEAEFEDDAHNPLVLRRARMQIRDGSTWRTVDEHREAVPFDLSEGLDTIRVDQAVLDEGLVVVLRESMGTAADAADRVPAGTAPSTPLRLRVEQVSSVEHAIVLGVPTSDPDHPEGPDRIRMTAGTGRPLVLTTLEPDEAMRILTEGATRGPRLAALALGSGLALIALGLAWAVVGGITGTALGASPSPTAATGGDPRSGGQGPGLVGDPLTAVFLVLGIGVVAMLGTLLYVRLTGGDRT